MDCAVVDLETTSISATGEGFILCGVIKPLRKDPIVFRYDELNCRPAKEGKLVKKMLEELSNYDMWIGHNIDRFDFQYLKSRANLLGVPFNASPLTFDTMLSFRRIGMLTVRNPTTGKPRAGLDFVVDFFNIPQLKTKVGYPNAHWRTVWGDKKTRGEAMDTLVSHCIYDTVMTERVYWKELKLDPVWGLRRKR